MNFEKEGLKDRSYTGDTIVKIVPEIIVANTPKAL
jgi:hypothetical protein